MTRPAITDGPSPKYAQLKAELVAMATTELHPDDAVPSERALMSRYGVSRATVRRAIDDMVTDGVLHRIQGKGTFVSRPRLESDLHLASFSQDMTRRGLVPSTAILTLELDSPPTDIASTLELPRRGKAWHLERIRFANDVPIALEDGWYPQHLLPDLDHQDLSGSLYDVLSSEYGLAIDHAAQTLWGETAGPPTVRRLKAPAHAALLVFRRISSAGGVPVEYVVSRYRGDRYSLHMDLNQPHHRKNKKEAAR